MGFETLLGNDQLKENLHAARRKNRLSHFYLLSGPRGAGKHTLADLIAAAMLCKEPDGPCGVCRSCRKVLSHNHPDYITIDDPTKKTVPVDLIREARADIFVRPNEGDKKIYLFPRAQDMGIPGQNALLKVLEEPPAYGVFLLLTDNPEKLLPTVRSRCVELKLQQEDQTSPPDMDFLQALAAAKPGKLAEHAAYLENRKISREQLQALLQTAWRVCAEALLVQKGKPTPDPVLAEGVELMTHRFTAGRMAALTELLHRYALECQYNVGPGHVLGALAAEWENTL